jgi:hypothetical protein
VLGTYSAGNATQPLQRALAGISIWSTRHATNGSRVFTAPQSRTSKYSSRWNAAMCRSVIFIRAMKMPQCRIVKSMDFSETTGGHLR